MSRTRVVSEQPWANVQVFLFLVDFDPKLHVISFLYQRDDMMY